MHAVGGLIAFAVPLDFRGGLLDSREGPWEVMTPRSSCPGEEHISSLGRGKPPARCEINTLTRNAASSQQLTRHSDTLTTWIRRDSMMIPSRSICGKSLRSHR